MAKNATTKDTVNKAPSHIAWTVTNKGDKAFWQKIGACWEHRDERGLTLQLEVLPLDGRIVLREPAEPEAV